jgi:hypothetical protein
VSRGHYTLIIFLMDNIAPKEDRDRFHELSRPSLFHVPTVAIDRLHCFHTLDVTGKPQLLLNPPCKAFL